MSLSPVFKSKPRDGRRLLEAFRRLRRWRKWGVGLPSDFSAKVIGVRGQSTWESTMERLRPRPMRHRQPVLAAETLTLQPPLSFSEGQEKYFTPRQPVSPCPAVYRIDAAIYHGWHGAVIDSRGLVYPELLDDTPERAGEAPPKEEGYRIAGCSMALSCTKNYFHWLLKMIPRLVLLERAGIPLDGIDTFLVNNPSWQQREVYERLGIWPRCQVIDQKRFAICRRLYAPTIAHDAPIWACEATRNLILPLSATEEKRPARIYLKRGEVAQRRLLNEEEVIELLVRRGFAVLDCSQLPIAMQAGLFADAECIVALHGAALSNLVFCRAGTRVLEIFGTTKNQPMYWWIANRLRLRYHAMLATTVEDTGPTNRSDVRIDCAVLAHRIDQLSAPAPPVPDTASSTSAPS